MWGRWWWPAGCRGISLLCRISDGLSSAIGWDVCWCWCCCRLFACVPMPPGLLEGIRNRFVTEDCCPRRSSCRNSNWYWGCSRCDFETQLDFGGWIETTSFFLFAYTSTWCTKWQGARGVMNCNRWITGLIVIVLIVDWFQNSFVFIWALLVACACSWELWSGSFFITA